MAKDSYNIDDILSEVKKRKELEREAEKALEADVPEVPQEEVSEEMPETAPEEMPETAPEEMPETAPEVMPETAPEEMPETAPEVMPETAPEETAEETPPSGKTPSEEEMVNILDYAEEEPEAPLVLVEETVPEEDVQEKVNKSKSKTKKILTAVIIVLLVLIVIAGGIFFVKARGWLKLITEGVTDTPSNVTTTEWQGMKKLIENFDPIQETEATELSSMEDMVKTWYYNGSPVSSTHVLNILLIGEDTRGREILEDETRADAAIIASVNIDTGEIVLTSILRDSWAYWETTPGDESTGQFGKLNGAMSTGDINVYINSLERLYKIKIDNYAIVNFTSFEKIIDKLYKKGIELELTDAEINEINNHPKRYGNVVIEKTFEGNKGKIRLNGKQALAYCRIRHIDTDNARADRQKTTLMTIFNDYKDASTISLLKLVDTLAPYVKTGYSSNMVVRIASYAFSQGWMNYDVHTINYPYVNVTGGNYGSEFFSQWIWRADFPADAYDIQMRIYGKSNITLARLRVDTKTVKRTGFYQDGAYPTSSTYINNHYGEVTTVESWEEFEATSNDE